MKTPFKERLCRGDICTGTFLLFLSGGDVAQFFAGLGFDFLVLDMEHSSFDLSKIRETILVARTCGVATIVRVPEVQYHLVTKVLDAGAEGILLPRVESPEECRDLVTFARYNPIGERGISTFAGHNDYASIPDVGEFVARRNRDIFLMVQLETRTGVENREAILSVPGIDGGFVGTGDLALSMGYPGQVDHPEVIAAAEQVFMTCREKNLVFCLPLRKPEDVERWQNAGLTMLSLSTDGGLLAMGCRQVLSRVKQRNR